MELGDSEMHDLYWQCICDFVLHACCAPLATSHFLIQAAACLPESACQSTCSRVGWIELV